MAAEIPRIRRNCQYYLAYGNRHFCKLPWRSDISLDPLKLDFGCPKDCADFSHAIWKNYPDLVQSGEEWEESKE